MRFLLLSFLAWNICWHNHEAAASSSPVSMVLASTFNVPIDASFNNGIKPQVYTGLYNLNTYRAFYFTYEAQSQMVEVFLPPNGAMASFPSVNVTYGSSQNAKFISLISSITDPESPNSSIVYVYSAGGVLLKYNITTTPSSGDSPQPSTFQLVSYISLPPILQSVESLLVLGDYLYVSSIAFLTTTRAYITRIPQNNFTKQYMDNNVTLIPLTAVSSLEVVTTDGTYIYYGANVGLVYRLDPVSFAVVNPDAPLRLTGVSSAFAGAFADPERNFVYFFTSDDLSPSALVRVNTTSFSQPSAPLVLGDQSGIAAHVVVHDVHGGHAYFGHRRNPGLITSVNLELLSVQSVLSTDIPFLQTAGLDASNSWAYFGTLTDFTILKIQLPLPCAGIDTDPGNSIGINNCSYPNGYCEYATCHCYPELDYEGPTCSSKKCLHDCYRDAANNTDGQSHGTCANGTCICAANYTSADCSIRRCPNDCLGRGSCTGSPSYKCICDQFYFGDDCSVFSLIPPCDQLHSCHECATNTSCGWCSSNGICMEGDSFGPFAQLCDRYSYQTCPSLFFFIFAYILTAVCWMFMLASAIVTIVQDFTLPDNTKTKRFVLSFWWRNQFAAKVWQMVEYIQMLAITGYLAVDMPALYSEFILPFQWSILHLPYPFSHPQAIRPPSRDLLTFFEEGRVVHSEAHELFLGNLFYYALIMVAPLALFAVPVALAASCMRDFSEKEKLMHTSKSRVVYCFIRLHQFVFFPLVVTSLFTLSWYSHAPAHPGSFKAAVTLSVFAIIGIGIGFPVFAFLKIYKKDKELFSFDFSQKYGSLYQRYHFRKGFFNTIQLCKLFVIAIWIALLYKHPIPQLILIAVTHTVYFVILLITKPNADHIHYFTDLVVTALSVVFFMLMLGFRNHSTAQHWALGVVVVHILALCVITVSICGNLLKMNGILAFADLKHSVGVDRGHQVQDPSTMGDTTGLQKELHDDELS